MQLTVTQVTKLNVEVSRTELAYAIMQDVTERLGGIDDVGCQWGTRRGHTYIADESWYVSDDPHIAALVDAANILATGHVYTLDENGVIVAVP